MKLAQGLYTALVLTLCSTTLVSTAQAQLITTITLTAKQELYILVEKPNGDIEQYDMEPNKAQRLRVPLIYKDDSYYLAAYNDSNVFSEIYEIKPTKSSTVEATIQGKTITLKSSDIELKPVGKP